MVRKKQYLEQRLSILTNNIEFAGWIELLFLGESGFVYLEEGEQPACFMYHLPEGKFSERVSAIEKQ